VLRAGDPLTVDVPAEGGFAAIACRWRPGLTNCDRPVDVIRASTVTVDPATVPVTPGASFTVSGRFTLDDRQPVSDVSLAPRLPAGWTVTGGPVTARRLATGQSVAGTWTVTAPADPPVGYLDLPVVATFRERPRGPVFEDQQTVRAHSWRPLPAGWSYLSDLPFAESANGLGPVERDTTNGGAASGDGRGIAIRRVAYGKGLGMFANGEVTVALDGRCTRFAADVGLDDEASLDIARTGMGGTIVFSVLGDGAVIADTGKVGTRDPARTLTVDVTGVKTLTLRVGDAGDGNTNDRASWADARVSCAP
jgi:hypothetical protein